MEKLNEQTIQNWTTIAKSGDETQFQVKVVSTMQAQYAVASNLKVSMLLNFATEGSTKYAFWSKNIWPTDI